MILLRLEGRKTSSGSRDFYNNFWGRQQKKFENPWVRAVFFQRLQLQVPVKYNFFGQKIFDVKLKSRLIVTFD